MKRIERISSAVAARGVVAGLFLVVNGVAVAQVTPASVKPPPAAVAAVKPVKAAQGPTTITSDRLEFDYRDMVALFEDNVVVTDPELKMTADRMLVYFDGTNDVRQVTAAGHVKVVDRLRRLRRKGIPDE